MITSELTYVVTAQTLNNPQVLRTFRVYQKRFIGHNFGTRQIYIVDELPPYKNRKNFSYCMQLLDGQVDKSHIFHDHRYVSTY